MDSDYTIIQPVYSQRWTGHNLFGLAHVFPKAISFFELSWVKRRHCEIKVDTV